MRVYICVCLYNYYKYLCAKKHLKIKLINVPNQNSYKVHIKLKIINTRSEFKHIKFIIIYLSFIMIVIFSSEPADNRTGRKLQDAYISKFMPGKFFLYCTFLIPFTNNLCLFICFFLIYILYSRVTWHTGDGI